MMVDDKVRREGVYQTPPGFATMAHQYLVKAFGDDIYQIRTWFDPCVGDGSLIHNCPEGTRLFISDLEKPSDEIGLAGCFRSKLDFLNDGPFSREPLGNFFLPDWQWENGLGMMVGGSYEEAQANRLLIIMNPPFAQGSGGQYARDGEQSRSGLSKTLTGDEMRKAKLGLATRNTACQFIYRAIHLSNLFLRDLILGVFSPAAIINGPGYGPFRDKCWFRGMSCKGGFCFNAKHFDNVNADWPCLFTMWSWGRQEEPITLDIFPEDIPEGHSFLKKTFSVPSDPLSAHVMRPKATVVRPPMSGPLSIATGKILVDRQSPDALATIYADGNDVQHSTSSCYIVSSSHPHTGSWSITPGNFEESMVLFSIRRLVIPTWLNWRDQFATPKIDHPSCPQWSLDAIIWSLFEGKNQTSSLGNMTYKGQVYDIPNHFFWMTPEEMMQIDGLPRPIWQQCRTAKPRFVASWLKENEGDLCEDAQEVLRLGKDLVRLSAPHRMDALPKFQLDRWDSGFYQIRMGLFGKKDVPFQQSEEMTDIMDQFKIAHKALGDRLRPHLHTLGVL